MTAHRTPPRMALKGGALGFNSSVHAPVAGQGPSASTPRPANGKLSKGPPGGPAPRKGGGNRDGMSRGNPAQVQLKKQGPAPFNLHAGHRTKETVPRPARMPWEHRAYNLGLSLGSNNPGPTTNSAGMSTLPTMLYVHIQMSSLARRLNFGEGHLFMFQLPPIDILCHVKELKLAPECAQCAFQVLRVLIGMVISTHDCVLHCSPHHWIIPTAPGQMRPPMARSPQGERTMLPSSHSLSTSNVCTHCVHWAPIN